MQPEPLAALSSSHERHAALSADQLRERYETFRGTEVPSDRYRERSREYLELLQHVNRMSDDELRAPDAQQYLWESGDLGSVGHGRNVIATAVYSDQQVVDALVALRRRDWPEMPGTPAQAIWNAYREIMAMVHPRLSEREPAAKLLRVFAVLLPAHFHRCFDSASNRKVTRLVLGRGHNRVKGSVLVRDKLRQVLGPEDGLTAHAERSFFCWWLHQQ